MTTIFQNRCNSKIPSKDKYDIYIYINQECLNRESLNLLQEDFDYNFYLN